MKLLLVYGVELNGEINDKEILFDFVCGYGKVDIVKMFLLYGVDINVLIKLGLKFIYLVFI